MVTEKETATTFSRKEVDSTLMPKRPLRLERTQDPQKIFFLQKEKYGPLSEFTAGNYSTDRFRITAGGNSAEL
jgi:hypothetical protein